MGWTNKGGFLTEKESLQNAQMIINSLQGKNGWKKASIAALIGNAYAESTVNPNIGEIGGGTGYGLLQWTPSTKLTSWCRSQGLDASKGESQIKMINHEIDAGIQWVSNRASIYTGHSSYKGSYKSFRTNKDKLNLNQLTEAFMWNYEGPAEWAANDSLAKRQNFAKKVYDNLDWNNQSDGGNDGGKEPDNGENKDSVPNVSVDTDGIIKWWNAFQKEMEKKIDEALTANLKLDIDYHKMYSNTYLIAKELLANQYQMKPAKGFDDLLQALFDEGLKDLKKSLDNLSPDFNIPHDPNQKDNDPDDKENTGGKDETSKNNNVDKFIAELEKVVKAGCRYLNVRPQPNPLTVHYADCSSFIGWGLRNIHKKAWNGGYCNTGTIGVYFRNKDMQIWSGLRKDIPWNKVKKGDILNFGQTPALGAGWDSHIICYAGNDVILDCNGTGGAQKRNGCKNIVMNWYDHSYAALYRIYK